MNGETRANPGPDVCTPIVPTADGPDNPEVVARIVNHAWTVASWRGTATSCVRRLGDLEAAGVVLNDAWWGTAVFPVMTIAEPDA